MIMNFYNTPTFETHCLKPMNPKTKTQETIFVASIISSMSANTSVSFSASAMVVGIVVNELNSVMGLEIFIPTIYHYLKRDNEKP